MGELQKEISILRGEVEKIKSRNKRVEADKAWETSFVRKLFIGFSTYMLVVLVLFLIGQQDPLLGAVVPAGAYLISTHSLSVVKSWWLKKRKLVE